MDNTADKTVTLEWRATSNPDARVLAVTGPLLISNFFDFQTAVREAKSPVTIVDLTGVPFLDSAALGAIIGGHVAAGRNKTKFALAGVAPRIMTMLEASGVTQILAIFPDVNAAITALA